MAFQSAPFPTTDALVNRAKGDIATKALIDWVTALVEDVDASPVRFSPVQLTTQGASIGTTALPLGTLAEGLYRVTTYARITRAATTSSSLTVTISWTESAVALSLSGSAMTGNTTGTVQSTSYLVRIDQATPISYATTYASVGGTSMQYRLDVVVEQVYA
jgi:hypothetical protein